MKLHKTLAFLSIPLAMGWGCSPSSDSDGGSPSGGDGDVSGDGDGAQIPGDGDGDIVVDASGGSESVDKPPAMIEETLPEGFTAANAMGGWKVLGPLADYSEPASNSCANVLRLIIRDFAHSHVDFGSEKPATWATDGLQGWYVGQVLPDLDPETEKPVVNPSRSPMDVMEAFEQWYVNLEGVNIPYVMDIWLQPDAANPGFFVFDSNMFFPLDSDPYIDYADAVAGHNFGFTTELRTAFEYKGGEVFTFRGDDDVFAFINGKLAVDIGGIHNAETASVDLDARANELGLEIGQVYDLLLYQAERNPGASNYRIETSLDFQSCGILESDIVVR